MFVKNCRPFLKTFHEWYVTRILIFIILSHLMTTRSSLTLFDLGYSQQGLYRCTNKLFLSVIIFEFHISVLVDRQHLYCLYHNVRRSTKKQQSMWDISAVRIAAWRIQFLFAFVLDLNCTEVPLNICADAWDLLCCYLAAAADAATSNILQNI